MHEGALPLVKINDNYDAWYTTVFTISGPHNFMLRAEQRLFTIQSVDDSIKGLNLRLMGTSHVYFWVSVSVQLTPIFISMVNIVATIHLSCIQIVVWTPNNL